MLWSGRLAGLAAIPIVEVVVAASPFLSREVHNCGCARPDSARFVEDERGAARTHKATAIVPASIRDAALALSYEESLRHLMSEGLAPGTFMFRKKCLTISQVRSRMAASS